MDAYLKILNSPRLIPLNSTLHPLSFLVSTSHSSHRAEFLSPYLSSHSFQNLLSSSHPSSRHHYRTCGNSESGYVHHADSNTVFFWSCSSKSVDGDSTHLVGRKDSSSVMVVLLGWLGAERRHMKKYADFYNSMGFDAVTFVVPVADLLWFDLGKRLEKRIIYLFDLLSSWISEPSKDGHDRQFLFHTFSNTGWLVYGALLEKFQRKDNLVEKVKGCIVDSGGDPELNPEIWAAGFSAAILKKWTSPMEPLLLATLVSFFSLLLKLPSVNKRLSDIIGILEKHQPRCPQLYLYSTVDKVIPYRPIELFMEGQRREGIDISCFNFQSSSHVHHFRTFPHLYQSQLSKFIAHCLHASQNCSYT